MVDKRVRRGSRAQVQGALFGGAVPLQTQVISRKKDFTALFAGFGKMRAISYVASPDLLLEFLDDLGYTELEVLVGENLSESYRKSLEQKGVAVTVRLGELVEQGRLRVLVPKRSVHTKLYLLEADGHTRVIQTSANLTDTAREASRQVNYAWYADLPDGDPLLRQVIRDYQSHTALCTLFMEDLTKLFREQPDTPRDRLVEVWLRTGAVDEEELESRRIFEEISSGIATYSDDREEALVTVRLPETPVARRHVERLLAPLEASISQNQIHVNGSRFVRYIHETHGVPYLRLDKDSGTITLGLEGSLDQLAEPPSDLAAVSRGLGHLEEYLNTVDTAQSANPKFAKMSMFESLLYVFASPFFNEYMRDRRERFGIVDTRGPRFLYIYGPSQNGKSTFLLFALKLLTGRNIRPLSRADFTKTKIANASMVATVFPLVFDDVTVGQSPGIEEVFKSHWERWWRDDYASPQIIMTSNTPRLRDWAKSRTKRVDFDVHFAPTERDKEKLNQLFIAENGIFRWFSYSYIQKLLNPEPPGDDELYLARSVITELYEYGGRRIPDYFPQQPLEKTYDPGLRDWRDLLFGIQKATTQSERGRLLVRFSSDLQHWEVNDYLSYLPQTVKYQRRGNTLIVENPSEFEKWIGPSRRRGLIKRLFRK